MDLSVKMNEQPAEMNEQPAEMNEQPAEMNKKQPAEILDIIDKIIGINSKTSRGAYVLTKGGLEIPTTMMGNFPQAILKPETPKGIELLNTYVTKYEQNYDIYKPDGQKHGPRRTYTPVTTLAVDSPPAAGGKRNKSKKPKRRNSRSKRCKTVSKRRR
jgi:hypothetical protein